MMKTGFEMMRRLVRNICNNLLSLGSNNVVMKIKLQKVLRTNRRNGSEATWIKGLAGAREKRFFWARM